MSFNISLTSLISIGAAKPSFVFADCTLVTIVYPLISIISHAPAVHAIVCEDVVVSVFS